MRQRPAITVYIDYKSPYAYLAKDLVYALQDDFTAEIDWLPYVLDIPSFLGSATLDPDGRVIEESRNAHQWRRVRYSYMDCRRQAAKRGLTIRGTRKIWDSTLAAAGLLYAKRQGPDVVRRYNDMTHLNDFGGANSISKTLKWSSTCSPRREPIRLPRPLFSPAMQRARLPPSRAPPNSRASSACRAS